MPGHCHTILYLSGLSDRLRFDLDLEDLALTLECDLERLVLDRLLPLRSLRLSLPALLGLLPLVEVFPLPSLPVLMPLCELCSGPPRIRFRGDADREEECARFCLSAAADTAVAPLLCLVTAFFCFSLPLSVCCASESLTEAGATALLATGAASGIAVCDNGAALPAGA